MYSRLQICHRKASVDLLKTDITWSTDMLSWNLNIFFEKISITYLLHVEFLVYEESVDLQLQN